MPIRIVVQELAEGARVVDAALEIALTKSVLLLERDLKPRMPIGVTETGRGSIAGEVRMGAVLGMGKPIGAVGSPLKHVAVINDGRRPGQRPPPAAALELWVRRKIVYSKRTGPRGGRRKLTTSEARGIAFLIARKIGREGMEGRHFFEKSLAENEAAIRGFFEEAGLQISIELPKGN
jgi:hypothetical protein